MPIYEYTCQECGSHFEKFVRSITAQAEPKCPECGGSHVKKGWSVFGTNAPSGGFVGLSASAAASACSTGGT